MMLNITPSNISILAENEIFVFGSNLAGKHDGGAAYTARSKFGAIQGKGPGKHTARAVKTLLKHRLADSA